MVPNHGTLTREGAAQYLHVSLPTLDGYLHRAKHPLPHVRAGRKYIISCELLNDWLREESRRQTGEGYHD